MKNIARLICILSLGVFLSTERNASAQTTVSFAYTGSAQTWVVPSCVAQITVTLAGGEGGLGNYCSSYYSTYCEGGIVVGTMTVTTGETINVFVGGAGAKGITSSPGAAGGWNGGGYGAYYSGNYGGGGGGGASDIRVGGVALANRVVVAGGGGGEAYNYGCGTESGGSGGTATGQCGLEDYSIECGSPNPPGGGGSQVAGGAGGFLGGYCTATSGSLGLGGAGGSCSNDGGGGGGGYYGGGGGVWGGGGGGSSYTGGLTSVISNNLGGQSGNGQITIQYVSGTGVATNVISNVTCDGGNNGSASATVTVGSAPYTYTWAPTGQTNATATGLTAGIYTVTVTSSCGTTTAAVTITQPNPLVVSASIVRNIVCNGGATGKVTCAPSGGAMPFTYSWSPSGETTDTATALTAGSYTVTVMDACGSSASASTSISQPNPIGIGAVVTANETCNGGSNGSALAFAYSGTPAYTYSWAPSGGTKDSAVGLTAGNYTVTAKDSCGQTATVQVVINQPGPIIVSLAATANSICRGDYNGSASSSISGGTAPYNYSWTGGAGTRDTAVGLTAGSYTLSVVDVNGCTGSSSVTITEPNVLAVAGGVTTDVSCNGGSNGSAMATPSGGTMPYTYTWYPAGGNSSSATGLSAGTYMVTVNDVCGGGATASVTITQTNAIVVMTGTTANVLCNGGSDGSASSSTTGGTMPYMYSWSGGSTTDTATGLSAGSYTLTVTDMNGCTGSVTGVITQPTALNVVKNSIPDNGKCTGSAWVTVSGGVSPYSYLWGNGSTTYNITGQCKGTYCCTVTDANGCKDSVCIDISSDLGIAGINSGGGAINVYPNPNNGQFTIQSSVISGQSTVEIYNMLGEKVYSTNFDGGTNTINIGNQPNGVYLYRAITQTGDLLGEGKIIIQK